MARADRVCPLSTLPSSGRRLESRLQSALRSCVRHPRSVFRVRDVDETPPSIQKPQPSALSMSTCSACTALIIWVWGPRMSPCLAEQNPISSCPAHTFVASWLVRESDSPPNASNDTTGLAQCHRWRRFGDSAAIQKSAQSDRIARSRCGSVKKSSLQTQFRLRRALVSRPNKMLTSSAEATLVKRR